MNRNELKRAVCDEIFENSRHILQSQLMGIPCPVRSFDPGRMDYRVDNIHVRIGNATEMIVAIAVQSVMDKTYLAVKNEILKTSSELIQKIAAKF